MRLKVASLCISAIFLLCFRDLKSLGTPGWKRFGKVRRFETSHTSLLSSSEESLVPETGSVETLNFPRWLILEYRRRADAAFISPAETSADVIFELWRAVLSGYIAMEYEQKSLSHHYALSFPDFKVNENKIETTLKDIISSVDRKLKESSVLFQPDYERKFELVYNPNEETDFGRVIVFIDTIRLEPYVPLDEKDILAFEPSLDKFVPNDVPGFPFDNVYDFISDVNRPNDPETLANLKVQFSVQDLKFDPSKYKNKKDPKEVINTLNVRLTRLQNWKELLQSDKFELDNDYLKQFPVQVRDKFQSLVSMAKLDPKRGLETQYDKRKVFINIIDKWSERLKRAFKFRYISRDKPIDYDKSMNTSLWKNDITSLISTLRDAPFLELNGPAFTPGSPKALFVNNMPTLRNMDTARCLYETVVWQEYVENAKLFGDERSVLSFGHINRHVYSRAFVTERAIHDVFYSLASWLAELTSAPISSSSSKDRVFPETDITGKVSSNPPAHDFINASLIASWISTREELFADRSNRSAARDHTEEFMETLSKLNEFSRWQCSEEARSVKELYREYYNQGLAFIPWFSAIVKDLDLTDKLDGIVRRKRYFFNSAENGDVSASSSFIRWSREIDDLMKREVLVKPDYKMELSDEDYDLFDEIQGNWTVYKRALECAEEIQELLPWPRIEEEKARQEDLFALYETLKTELDKEPVSFRLVPDRLDEVGRKNIDAVLKQIGSARDLPASVRAGRGGRGHDEGEVNPAHLSAAEKRLYLTASMAQGPSKKTMFVVLPRFFPGYGLTADIAGMELNAFLQFCGGVADDLDQLLSAQVSNLPFKVRAVPMHPLMSDVEGRPVYHLRSPHPTIAFVKEE